jgi:hypothetical protein
MIPGIEGNPGKWEISRDKYLGTACFFAKKQENKLQGTNEASVGAVDRF